MFDDEWWITIQEYPGIAPVVYWYAQSEFAPVVSSEVLAEELSEIFSEGIAVVK